MRNLTLMLCLVALAGAVASGVLFFLIGDTKNQLHQQWQTAEAQLQTTRDHLQTASERILEIENRNRLLDADLAAAKRDLTASRLQAEQLQQSLDLAEEARSTALAAREGAVANLTAAHAEIDALRAQLATSLAPVEAQRYRRIIADLEARIGELEQFIARHHADPELIAGRSQHAQIIRVGTQNAFVVINFGSNHGARPNQRLTISRGTDSLALVEISRVSDHYSIAQVLPEYLSGNLRRGDAAALTP